MRKIGNEIQDTLGRLAGNSDEARINLRIKQVRERYRCAIERVYPPETARMHLAHTNNVIISHQDQICRLIVYVDDSLFAAELNAQRELIKLCLLELFGEEIDEFQIKTSQWKKYRDVHPYTDEEAALNQSDTSISAAKNKGEKSCPLSEEERARVASIASVVEDERVRESLERAMTADLEWKKGEKV